jgi:hypothetical protein
MSEQKEITRRTPLAAVLCVRAKALFDRAVLAAQLVHNGTWLGLLTAEERVAVTAYFYSNSRTYLGREHNASGLFVWERPAIERYFRPGSSLLVTAAGAGREVLQLRRMGFHVQGFECSPSLVRASEKLFREQDGGSPIMLALPNEVPAGLPGFDGVVVGWGGYHHIPGRERRIRFLRQLRSLLGAGSPLLVSFFHRADSEAYDKWLSRVARVVRLLTLFRGEPVEPGDRLTSCTQCHCFTETEIREELKAAGFRMDHYSVEEYGHAVGIAE